MFGKGSRFYIVLSVVFALAAVGFLWGGRRVDVGFWPALSAALAVLGLLRAWSLSPRIPRVGFLVVSAILAGGALWADSLPPVLVIEKFTVTTTESWKPSREELAVAVAELRHHIETTEDGCELLAIDDPVTGTTGVSLLSHGRCAFRFAREGRQ
jgi:hypothetical protein